MWLLILVAKRRKKISPPGNALGGLGALRIWIEISLPGPLNY
jgi:hypothetical protein